MKAKKKLSLMIAVIILLQIILPMLSIIWESGFTIKSVAADTLEATVNGITWTYELDKQNNAINVKPKDKSTLPTEVVIPSTLDKHAVTSIGSSAFSLCRSLTSITIPEGVTSIENFAFNYCRSLTSITIPSSVTSIGDDAFSRCSSLTSINVDENNQDYSSEGGVLFNKEKTEIICYPSKKVETNYVIPSTVTRIKDYAFSECRSLTNITIPSSVTSIGTSAFRECSSLTSITISSTVTRIGYYAFRECSRLTSITIPSSVTSIGENAFFGCSSLTSINVDENNQNYSSEGGILFNKERTKLIIYPEGNARTSYSIPEGVTRIGYGAFENCSSLTSITIPSSVTEIGNSAFDRCSSLRSIKVNKNNPNYMSEDGVLFNKERTELIQYPNGNLRTSYSIPEGVTSIGSAAFEGCSSLTIYCKSNSIAKTYAESNNIKYIIDDTAPVITSIEENPSSWTKENVVLKVNATDNQSGLADKAYSFDGGTTWQAENSKTYTENTSGIVVKVRDKSGNTVTQTVNVTKIDKEAPVITSIEGNPSSWTKENVILKVNATDNQSGLADKAYSFDGGTTWQAENSKTYTENISGIVVKVRDRSGNIKTYEKRIDITKITKLTGIEITKQPSNTSYLEGQRFDKTGMEIKAIFDNGTKEIIEGYIIRPEGALKTEDTNVTMSYTINGVTKTTEQKITVIKKGDANGDGKVDFMDTLAINKHRLGKSKLKGIYLKAADVNGDSKVDFMDILQINKYRLGKINSL